MKGSGSVMSTATKFTLVLFGIVPLIGFLLFGDANSFVSWLEVDLILGAVFFLSYLVIGSLSKNKPRLPMKKIYA
ncbi:hypothetical protein [Nitrosomonas sp. Nm166]|uniref:hypothetical protein n=1 Tax=Nitrosomonas sp. Nm166 TaxID=1881054 RepID=UPI0008E4D724|nr:hypothetical protein [Nitrosomonas sp. Nm166]SFF15046.1 hypothetical protein SAMN05428977_10579 [Nitrosomonas sp. Nm166]